MQYQAACLARLSLLFLPIAFAAAASGDDAPVAAPAAQTILHLNSGSFAAGELVDSPMPGTLRWQAAAFVTPFEFQVDSVNAIHWPPPAAPPGRAAIMRSSWRPATSFLVH